ncbi:hypothetical protein GCK72_023217 [Caenorhabditis remanei]|uniref:aspartate transaminase n=1 Tax=Caenorhabditis remanei TaxID=31234 RepID=A0A6A5FVS7_CAERE|nr:hypothetical protein GCK72_023217 [Caenorhabditis remanei]KAF1746760.1 hypothetical protein GCK72_023217 [Caenorhabditis remanei]
MSSFFDCVVSLDADSPLNDSISDENENHVVDLTLEAYRTDDGQPFILPVVREALLEYAKSPYGCHDYLPILGHVLFRDSAMKLVLGEDSRAIKENRAAGIQCLSGTGTLRSGAEFLVQVLHLDTVYISNPTCHTQFRIFEKSGFKSIKTYSYLDQMSQSIDVTQMIKDLEIAPEKSVVVLSACAHNPTGLDPSRSQWKEIFQVIKRRNLFPFFTAFDQGLASGDLDDDAWAVRYFVEMDLEMFIAQSMTRTFGLYSSLVGNLTVVARTSTFMSQIASQFTCVNVSKFSNPPAHGACIVKSILTNQDLKIQWTNSLKTMYDRLKDVRNKLISSFEKMKTPGHWIHLKQQKGLFLSTGLNSIQITYLLNNYGVRILDSGCLSLSGLNTQNVEYVASAIDAAVRQLQ